MQPSSSPVSLPELLYIHDPLCGWCYGMSPVINRIQQEFAGRLEVSVLCGGMVTGAEVQPIAAKWNYIKHALADVEKASGVTFGAAFKALGEAGTCIQDSEPPSRAIATFRQMTQDPARTVAFAHEVQAALFRDGHDLNAASTYTALLVDTELDIIEYQRRFAAPETAQATQQEFAAVARIGVQGFPTCILRLGEQGYVLARGFQPYEPFRQGLEQLLAQETM